MKNFKKILGTALIALAPASLYAGGALASSHREAPAISQDPTADNTDLYAWVTPGTHDKLIVLANYIPLEEPSGGPNFHTFSDDVLYTVHVDKGDKIDKDFATYQITFHTTHTAANDAALIGTAPNFAPTDTSATGVLGNGINFFSQISGDSQTYTVTKIDNTGKKTVLISGVPVAPPNIGPRTEAVVHGGAAYDDTFTQTFVKTVTGSGERVFAGPRDDGFYVDLGGVFDLANLRPSLAADGSCATPPCAQDGVAGYNVHSIALEIPLSTLGFSGTLTQSNDNVISVWASASRRKVTVLHEDGSRESSGPFVQVSRLGQPLINEAVIGLEDKDRWNALAPKDDVAQFGGYFLNPIIVRDAEAVGIYTALGVDPTPFKTGRTDILDTISIKGGNIALTNIGDVLRVDPTKDSAYPNGRALQGTTDVLNHTRAADQENGDVTDIELSLLLAKLQLIVSDGVNHNDKPFLDHFPFLNTPFRGFDEGHGKPTLP